MKKQDRPDIVARADEAFGSANYAEYSVEKKKEGAYKTKRFLMVLAYIGLFALLSGIVVLVNTLTGGAIGMFVVVLIALVPLGTWVLIHFTWGYVSYDYKYVIDHAEFTAFIVYGGKKDKKLFSCKTKDFRLIAPNNEQYKPEVGAFGKADVLDITPSMNAEDVYFGLVEDEYGKKNIIYFQVTSHTLKALKYYNKDALIMTETRR